MNNIEQTKFTYSPLGKAFQEQIKRIKEQGQKQVKAIKDKEFNKSVKEIEYGSDDNPMILKQKEIYNELTKYIRVMLQMLILESIMVVMILLIK